ncbi:MAG: MATE family efflux transporter [Acidobacteria bacterium]|nr:MATE family efflux transporter [Acidobacteriota bacterium]MCI0620528.1 MATE family efflux transporter [Acidobacteriota bacterium]MCI0722416.1 MATE family efflux transporter [Acidobacteriota bacterium]
MNPPADIQPLTPSPASRPEGRWAALWADLREAVRGTQQDFTQGSLGRAIVLLSVPTVLEMSMESLFGIVDVFWVASLGPDAVAAVGLTEGLLTLIFAAAMGLCMGTTAMVARRFGEKDHVGAGVAAVQSILLGLLISLPVGLAGILFTPQLFRLMGASPEVVATGSIFGAIMLGGNATIFLLFLINAIFRGAGDAVSAMRALWIGNAVNLLLDPCLIFGWGPFPEMGVTGNAIATNIGRGIGVLYQVSVLYRGRSRLVIRREQLRVDWPVLRRLLRVSLSGMFQFLIPMASYLVLVRIVAMFGSAALAGYTIALRIIIVAILPSWGMCNAAATLVGQNLGAQKPDRAEKSVWTIGFYNMIFLCGVAVIFIIFAEPMIQFFTQDSAVVTFGIDCLRLVSYGYGFYAYGMVLVQAFNGAGDTDTPTIINVFCYWLFQLPLAYALALPFGLGAHGVFLAITVAESVLALVSIFFFRLGRWKEQKI